MKKEVVSTLAVALGMIWMRPAYTAQRFMPTNDLWMQDTLSSEANIDKNLFGAIADAGLAAYAEKAAAHKEKLLISQRWADPTVNADTQRAEGKVTITLYGGLARREEVTPDALALVLCHELGHAYGGKPYLDSGARLSAEGQADYHGAGKCLSRLLNAIPLREDLNQRAPFVERRCGDKFGSDTTAVMLCKRGLYAAERLGRLLALLGNQDVPEFQTPDLTVVEESELLYPRTIQCRLDTYYRGLFNLPRPHCWFRKSP